MPVTRPGPRQAQCDQPPQAGLATYPSDPARLSRIEQPIVILGAGINGAALARELAVCGLPVWVVDSRDVCFGTTAYSSRLIHGGLRYLEYGDLALVRESLAERGRLLRLAPQFVRPLELLVPVSRRLGGWIQGLRRLAGREPPHPRPRGLWAVRAGLLAYDLFASGSLPRHRLLTKQERARLPLHPRYAWVCSFYDAQVLFPERLVLAFLADAQLAARKQGNDFRVYTYSRVQRQGPRLHIEPQFGRDASVEVEPLAVVNASGPWVDTTLTQLEVPAPRLIAGTKGSHLLTAHPALRAALGERGLYVEAPDGRPVFILPFGETTLVGTTDLPYEGDPAQARATQAELEYLCGSVNQVLPSVGLTAADIELHYCGVRPLRNSRLTPAARSRRHSIEPHCGVPWPLISLVGGKLTTCRELAAEAADWLLARIELHRAGHTTDRLIPGAEGYPANEADLNATCDRLAGLYHLRHEQVRAVWRLYGTRTETVLSAALTSPTPAVQLGLRPTAAAQTPVAGTAPANRPGCEAASRAAEPTDNGPAADHAHGPCCCVAGTCWPVELVRWVIDHEWVRTVSDLVERRLMLLYDRGLSQATLAHLAELLVEAGRLPAHEMTSQVDAARARLAEHFGKRLAP